MATDPRRRRRWRLLLDVAVGLPLLYVMLRWFEHRQVYHPTTAWVATGAELNRAWEDVSFTAADGTRLNGWFFPAATNSPRRQLVVLHCHGNGGNISHRLAVADALLGTGVNVFLFDYRGYGRSAGRPSEEGTYRDAEGASAWLRGRGFAATNIIVFGESLGGAVATELARREPVGGLVLQSTFTSIPDIGAELFPWLPVRWLARIHYDTRAKLPAIHVPVLVMHSRADTLVPFHHAEQNFAAANEPKLLIDLAGDHNDFLEAGRGELVGGLEKFLELRYASSPATLPAP
jgi:fermentation-respiration switch protein FrsA (DUF1100 family)